MGKPLARNTRRLERFETELTKLSEDHDANEREISKKQIELAQTRAELDELRGQIDRAEEYLGRLFCPYCKAPMVERAFWDESVEYEGRDINVDHEVVRYECGLTIKDDSESNKCPRKLSVPKE